MSKESHCQNFQTTGLILGFRLLYSHSQESKCKDLPVFSVLDVLLFHAKRGPKMEIARSTAKCFVEFTGLT